MRKEYDERLVSRVLDNLASAEEAREVANWFSTDEGQEYLSARMFDDWKRMSEADRCAAPQDNDETQVRMMERLRYGIRQEKKRGRAGIIIAASLAVPLVLALSSLVFLTAKMKLFTPVMYSNVEVPVGERMQVLLSDGTSVMLNSMSKLTYPSRFGLFSRRVKLDGEAYFSVAKDAGRPFTVESDNLDVKVTGTRFNIKAYRDEPVKVTLDEGSVLLDDHRHLNYSLKPGESAEYNGITGDCRISRPIDMEPVSSWRENRQCFSMALLDEVLHTLERQYGVSFDVKDPKVLDGRFTLSFPNSTPIEDVLKDIEAVSYVSFHKSGNRRWQVAFSGD
mgnify:FL=1